MELVTIPLEVPREQDWHGRQVTYTQPKECPIMREAVRSSSEGPRTGIIVGIYLKTNEDKFQQYCKENDLKAPAKLRTTEDYEKFYERYFSMLEEDFFFFVSPDDSEHETIVQNLELGPLKGTFLRREDIQKYSEEQHEEAMLTHPHEFVRLAAQAMMDEASVIIVWPPKVAIELSEGLMLLK